MATLPTGVNLQTQLQYVDMPTRTFVIDHVSNQIAGMDAGLQAMTQAVDIILNNERFKWQIYTQNFGSELEDLPREDYNLIVSEFPRRIEEAFSVDNRILGAENYQFINNKDSMTVVFDVLTVFGTISEEVTL